MAARPTPSSRARVVFALLLPLLCSAAQPAGAIALRWSTGETNLSVSQDTRALLIAQADSAELTLPETWRLLWTADSLGVRFAPFDPSSACLVDTAKVDSITPPQSSADSSANLITAHLCSSGMSRATSAYLLVDIPAGGRGKLKIVSIDPNDTTQVVESNEATFNDGVAGDYSPTIHLVSVSHEGSPLLITATGSSLASVTSATVVTPDTTWRIPLTIQGATDSTIILAGTMPQALQGASLLLSSAGGPPAAGHLPDDAVFQPENPDGVNLELQNLSDPTPGVRPKDFAVFYNTVYTPPPLGVGWEGVYHVYYIRHMPDTTRDTLNEITFAHAWYQAHGGGWQIDTAAFNCGHAYWDYAHVWAPSIIFRGGQYTMYYTGVDANGNQRIGYATIPAIGTSETKDTMWSKQAEPIFSADSARWMAKTLPQQCRDPYVMANPDGSGLIMVYTGMDISTGAMAVGLAKSFNGLTGWTHVGHYVASDFNHAHAGRVESPHIFADSASSTTADRLGLPLGEVPGVMWRLLFTDGAYASGDRSVIMLSNSGSALTDTSLEAWSHPDPTTLFAYAVNGPGDANVFGLQATECLRAGNVYLLCGFKGLNAASPPQFSITFRRLFWSFPGQATNPDFVIQGGHANTTAVPGAPRATGALRFSVLGIAPCHGEVRFRIESPLPMRVRLVIHDVMGRVVKRMFDQSVSRGNTYVSWDGRGESGDPVASGIYFARLSAGREARVARLPLVH